jgi:hypothetical protein
MQGHTPIDGLSGSVFCERKPCETSPSPASFCHPARFERGALPDHCTPSRSQHGHSYATLPNNSLARPMSLGRQPQRIRAGDLDGCEHFLHSSRGRRPCLDGSHDLVAAIGMRRTAWVGQECVCRSIGLRKRGLGVATGLISQHFEPNTQVEQC